MKASAGENGANAIDDRASRTYSQLGLDADDTLFGHFSHALLKCETLAKLHAMDSSSREAASTRETASRISQPQPPVSPADKSSPFRVTVTRTGPTGGGSDTDGTGTTIRPTIFVMDSIVPDQNSFSDDCDSLSPGSSAWRVRTAFAARTSTECDAVDEAPQTAIRVTLPTRTLTKHAWLDSAFVTVLMWILPAATAVLYFLASRPNQHFVASSGSNVIFVISFFACGLLSLALILARLETSFLLKTLLCTFEAAYLIAWMLVYLVTSIVQIQNETDLRTAQLGLDSDQYILFCAATFFCVTTSFVVVLFSDALIHISAGFKIYVRFHIFFSSDCWYKLNLHNLFPLTSRTFKICSFPTDPRFVYVCCTIHVGRSSLYISGSVADHGMFGQLVLLVL